MEVLYVFLILCSATTNYGVGANTVKFRSWFEDLFDKNGLEPSFDETEQYMTMQCKPDSTQSKESLERSLDTLAKTYDIPTVSTSLIVLSNYCSLMASALLHRGLKNLNEKSIRDFEMIIWSAAIPSNQPIFGNILEKISPVIISTWYWFENHIAKLDNAFFRRIKCNQVQGLLLGNPYVYYFLSNERYLAEKVLRPQLKCCVARSTFDQQGMIGRLFEFLLNQFSSECFSEKKDAEDIRHLLYTFIYRLGTLLQLPPNEIEPHLASIEALKGNTKLGFLKKPSKEYFEDIMKLKTVTLNTITKMAHNRAYNKDIIHDIFFYLQNSPFEVSFLTNLEDHRSEWTLSIISKLMHQGVPPNAIDRYWTDEINRDGVHAIKVASCMDVAKSADTLKKMSREFLYAVATTLLTIDYKFSMHQLDNIKTESDFKDNGFPLCSSAYFYKLNEIRSASCFLLDSIIKAYNKNVNLRTELIKARAHLPELFKMYKLSITFLECPELKNLKNIADGKPYEKKPFWDEQAEFWNYLTNHPW